MQNDRRYVEIIVAVFLVLLGASALGPGGNPFVIVLAIAGLYLLLRQFENNRSGRSRSAPARPMQRPTIESEAYFDEQSGKERIYRHALESVKAAGLDPEQVRVLATDIGFMAFSGASDPVVYRSRDIPDDVDYIQPFVQLRLPTKANGRIRFEVIDSDGQVLFVHEENHELDRGRNLVMPAARLPIHDAQAMHNAWELRISADGMPLASHTFDWEETTTRVVRRHLSEDGEISSELRAAMAESRLQKMSLDDLLADQENDPEDRMQNR